MWDELCLHPPPLNYPRPPARPVVEAETLRHWAEMNSRWRASLVMTPARARPRPYQPASSHLGSVRVTYKIITHNKPAVLLAKILHSACRL